VEEPEDQEKQVRRGEKEERERERGGGRRRRSEEAQNTRAQLNNARGRQHARPEECGSSLSFAESIEKSHVILVLL
jgi:hypothetical protein